ncbi:MAG TPA: hypothetical protein VGL47_39610 [Amycolatopsis sp.]|uniref:Uncharacterized protein n=1 Tax=Amycolatopsis nalaikhensis TaxID=715472 RepID=A0ABY8XEQ1_9PSEU|nr:hypothetical protein [Amycolatopsis sp. 2-2]WIV54104.1 hypothetical protein QP939_35290 [Amycolatopsis sp. 2-2]
MHGEPQATWYLDVHGNKGVLIGDHNTVNFVETQAPVLAVMSGPVAENEAWLAMFEALAGAEADIGSAKARLRHDAR